MVQYVSKDTHLIEEALEKVLAFSPNPAEPLRSVIKGLKDFLSLNVTPKNAAGRAWDNYPVGNLDRVPISINDPQYLGVDGNGNHVHSLMFVATRWE